MLRVRVSTTTRDARRSRRLSTSLILALATTMGATGTAYAAGSFTSSLDNVAPGFGSRVWEDTNGDANQTVIRSWSCWDNQQFFSYAQPTYELLKRNIGPVTSNGRVTTTDCKGNQYSYARWSRPPAGNYNFAYRLVNGYKHTFSAAEIYVSW